MKKIYLLLVIIFSFNISSKAQIYSATTIPANFEVYNPGDAKIGFFDDVLIPPSALGGKLYLDLTKVRVGILRGPNAPATDVEVWVIDNSLYYLLGTFSLPVNGPTATPNSLVIGDGTSVLERLELDFTTYNANYPGYGAIYVGLSFTDETGGTGWISVSPPTPPLANVNESYEVDLVSGAFDIPFAGVGGVHEGYFMEVFGNPVSLPIELGDFAAKQTGKNQANLKWNTLSEKNNLGFDIEKSTDGETYEKIGFVKGNGNSVVRRDYDFSDNRMSQSSYYRLKQLDDDTKFTYSKVVFAENTDKNKGKSTVFPNPTKGKFVINHDKNTQSIVITNLIGQTIFQAKTAESLLTEIDVSNQPNGVYQIYIIDKSGNAETYKLVVNSEK